MGENKSGNVKPTDLLILSDEKTEIDNSASVIQVTECATQEEESEETNNKTVVDESIIRELSDSDLNLEKVDEGKELDELFQRGDEVSNNESGSDGNNLNENVGPT